jgi:hypothetical protein
LVFVNRTQIKLEREVIDIYTPLFSMFLGSSSLFLVLQQLFMPQQSINIQEDLAQKFISSIKSSSIQVSPVVATSGVVRSTYVDLNPSHNDKGKPLVLLHGFDSSCLEFRRLAPLLAENVRVYIPDILGWGFSDISNVKNFSPEAKMEHLMEFVKQVVGEPCILVGASLVSIAYLVHFMRMDQPSVLSSYNMSADDTQCRHNDHRNRFD